jgi:hypothetical protein
MAKSGGGLPLSDKILKVPIAGYLINIGYDNPLHMQFPRGVGPCQF